MSVRSATSNKLYDSIRASDAATVAEPTVSGFAHLAGHKYCLIVSFKRSGERVPTPVWFGLDADGKLYFRSYADGAKLRRIRNDSRVLVAPCSNRGKPLGPAAEGRARVLGPEDDHAERIIQSNYGRFRQIYTAGNDDAAYVEVVPV